SLLHKTHPITVFELRPQPSPSALQTPSGSLDLHEGTGLLALEKCNLLSQFKQASNKDCTEETTMVDMSGEVRFHDKGESKGSDRPEISRNVLSHMLLSTIPPSVLRWNTKILSVTPGKERAWKFSISVDKQEPQEEEFDLVVGADGAWSKARLALPDAEKPVYSGISYLLLTIPRLSEKHNALVGTGSYMAYGEHKTMVSQRSVGGSTRMYLMITTPSPTYFADEGFADLSPAALKEKLLSPGGLFSNWGEEIKDLIAAGCAEEEKEPEARPLYAHPVGKFWTHTPGLTLIGDAAHLTTPNGEGVNVAMADALDLSEAILSSDGEEELDEKIKAYEEKMRVRGTESMEDAVKMKELMFERPGAFLEMIMGFSEKNEKPEW
ncbi:Monooxygenase asqM, partial [Lachnellula suecica]